MNREVLHIGVSRNGGTWVLRLTGELDSYTSKRLAKLSESWIEKNNEILVNLDKLDFIDSTGLFTLVGMWLRAKRNGAQLLLSCRNPRVYRVFEITGLAKLFTFVGAGARPAAPGTVPSNDWLPKRTRQLQASENPRREPG